ncbi:MAG: type II toxin-antitoxin system HicB family antitoxin [Anaerolineales bacterium]|nr:type II toxin-antitoxin system HicB family antitoxin [Anaerolineales bacterium]
MIKTPEDYLKLPYSRILIPDEGSYAAEIMELPGCFSQGDTPDEAITNLGKAARSWIQVALAQGLEIPEPYLNQGYAGKIALRLPRSMHRQATRLAERDGVSLNHFLVSAIAARIGAEDFYTRLVDKIERRLANMEQKISTLKLNAVRTGTAVNSHAYFPGVTANNTSPERHNA